MLTVSSFSGVDWTRGGEELSSGGVELRRGGEELS